MCIRDSLYTAPAQLRMFGVVANIFAVMPAADAFGMGAGQNPNRQRLPVDLDFHHIARFLDQGLKPGIGGDQEEAQFIANPAQISGQFAIAVQIHFGVQSGTNPARDPQFLQFLADRLAHRNQPIPIRRVQRLFIADRE